MPCLFLLTIAIGVLVNAIYETYDSYKKHKTEYAELSENAKLENYDNPSLFFNSQKKQLEYEIACIKVPSLLS